jgi:hypothetical protein
MRFALAGLILTAAATASGPSAARDPWVVPEVARACPQHGPGFVQVPGSDTCVRIGGRVAAEATAGSRRIARDQIAGFGASGSVTLDTRTNTEMGPVRTYFRVRAGERTGRYD